jgi:hypothetical protein
MQENGFLIKTIVEATKKYRLQPMEELEVILFTALLQ